ncbi:MAG: hypothetical protein IPG02_14430 [Ignavibacteria bacterium]|nr:hypothetical protein [Ignavibacteria bacterium]
MEKDQSDIFYQRVFIGLFILATVPFVLLFLYNHPSPEDFYFSYEARIKSLWTNTKVQYRHGTGRYFQNFLLYLTPVYDKFFISYKAGCFLFMASFFSSVLLSVSLLTVKLISFRERILISLVIIFTYLYAMPEVSSGFYWYGGISAYHSGIILVPIFFAFLVKSGNSINSASGLVYTFMALIVLILITGVNEILAILLFLFTLFLNIRHFVKDRSIKWQYVVFVIASGIFLYILLKSPGNKFRLTQFPGNTNFSYSFFNSFVFLYQNILSWIFNSPLLACSLILLPVYFKISEKKKNLKNKLLTNPVGFSICWIIVLYISVFFSYYSTTVVLSRTSNFIYFIFIAGWFYLLYILSNIIFTKGKFSFIKNRKYLYGLSLVFIILFLIKPNNITTAFNDLFSGSAHSYNRQLNERYQFLENCPNDSCRVDSLINIPKTIFYKDITSNSTMLSSEWYGNFFNKKSVALKIQNK